LGKEKSIDLSHIILLNNTSFLTKKPGSRNWQGKRPRSSHTLTRTENPASLWEGSGSLLLTPWGKGRVLCKDKLVTSSWNYDPPPGPSKKRLFSHLMFAVTLSRAVSSNFSRLNFPPVSQTYESPQRDRPFSFTRFDLEERRNMFLRKRV
jgi:hypothetical protein